MKNAQLKKITDVIKVTDLDSMEDLKRTLHIVEGMVEMLVEEETI